MSKVFSIIKATRSDIAFSNKTANVKKKNANKKATIGYLVLIVGVFFMYAFMYGSMLKKVDMTYVLLAMFSMAAVAMTLTGGLMKTGNMIYSSKDNDLLLSMPITKKDIYLSRVIKLILFEYIQTFSVMIPTVITYAIFEKPGISFYIISFLFILALPILPIILSCLVGYIVEILSSKMKKKNLGRTIISFAFFGILMYFSLSLSKYVEKIAEYAPRIAEKINGVYYPIKIYLDGVLNSNIMPMVYFLLANIVALYVFAILLSINYFKVISKLSEKHTSSNYKVTKVVAKSKIRTLIKKELKRYFSSTIYVINTLLMPIMLFGGGIYILFAKVNINELLVSMEIPNVSAVSVVISFGICVMLGTASTTACSLSMEGSKLTVIKSMPIKGKEVFLSKIITNMIIMLPLEIIGSIFIGSGLKMGISTTCAMTFLIICFQVFVSFFGLLVNLKFPKLDATNDTIIVKQSASAIITIFSIMIFAGIFIFGYMGLLKDILSENLFILISGVVVLGLSYVLWIILKKYGVKKFNEL